MLELDPLITEYQHEKFRPREAEALQTLRKVASLVKPIMRQRGWKVGILTEFWPPEKNLLGLNWNHGQKICLRLRYPYDERQFLPLEEVVDTMLHELCHIIHGPHDEPFHTLWNQLRTEHEQLARKGYTGEGFLSTGHKLGGGHIPKHEALRRARIAAEKRRTLSAGSGQKLGGAFVPRGRDMRQVIADAATRRATVTRGCASGTDRSRSIVEETAKTGFRTKADEEDANEEAIMQAYIDLIQEEEMEKYGANYVPASRENPAGSQGASQSAPPPVLDSLVPPPPRRPSPPSVPSSTKPLPAGSWACDICTLVNPTTYLCCDACGTERPDSSFPTLPSTTSTTSSSSSSFSSPSPSLLRKPNRNPTPQSSLRNNYSSSSNSNTTSSRSNPRFHQEPTPPKTKPLGWLCHQCGNWMESEWWTCAECGSMKLSS